MAVSAPKLKDTRKLETTSAAGIYRRHAERCRRNGRCKCSYVVGGRRRATGTTRCSPTFELAREFKGAMDSGKTTRKPLSSDTDRGYYELAAELPRPHRPAGLRTSTLREYGISFEHHILPLPIARTKLRDLTRQTYATGLPSLERRRRVAGHDPPREIALRSCSRARVARRRPRVQPRRGRPLRPDRGRDRAQARQTRAEQLTAADVVAILRRDARAVAGVLHARADGRADRRAARPHVGACPPGR